MNLFASNPVVLESNLPATPAPRVFLATLLAADRGAIYLAISYRASILRVLLGFRFFLASLAAPLGSSLVAMLVLIATHFSTPAGR